MERVLWPLVASSVRQSGLWTIITGPCLSALITNPLLASDQNLPEAEVLYLRLGEDTTPFVLQPGQSFVFPVDFNDTSYVTANTSGHAFSGYTIQEGPNYEELEALGETGKPFPPEDISTLTAVIPSYLYQQYTDDDDLQAFVAAFNQIANQYAVWFARTNPADYTQLHISGALLDWVAAGLYGMLRPSLPRGLFRTIGPLNTYVLNSLPLNVYKVLPPPEYELTTDDVFRRILTWHLYKDDGEVFTIRWLKRRVERFLTGVDGTAGTTAANAAPALAPDQTYDVSVTFGVGNEVNINLQGRRRRFFGGAILNSLALNTFYLNEFNNDGGTVIDVNPLAAIFKAAVDSGALELPFQYHFVVNVSE